METGQKNKSFPGEGGGPSPEVQDAQELNFQNMGISYLESKAGRNDLILALAKAQGQFPEVTKDRTVRVKPRSGGQEYEFRYATLGAIIKAIKKPLSDNGIAYTQTLTFDTTERLYYLETTLWHGDQTISSGTPLIIGDIAGNQQFGSALTYMRRYALAAIVGIVADEDDDGNLADGNEVKSSAETVSRTAPKPPAPDPISTGITGKPLTPQEMITGEPALVGAKPKYFETGKIDVPTTEDGSGPDWMKWGQMFIAQSREAPTLEEFQSLQNTNKIPLGNMSNDAPKLFTNLSMALIKARKTLEKPNAAT